MRNIRRTANTHFIIKGKKKKKTMRSGCMPVQDKTLGEKKKKENRSASTVLD